MQINRFVGKYRFLSNFYPCEVEYEGTTYPSVENAYQAAKGRREVRTPFQTCTPSEAKRMGRALFLSEGWDDRRLLVMQELVRKKFTDPDLSRSLLATGDAELVEGNYWGDRFWGVCDGQGENHLGKILMKVREEVGTPHPQEKHFIGKVTVKAVVHDMVAKKVLILRAPGILNELPGGRMNEGETLEQALERELKEELGLTPNDYWRPYFLNNEQCLHVTSGTTILSVSFAVPLKKRDTVLRFEEGVEGRWISEAESTLFPKNEMYHNCLNAIHAFWRSFCSA